MPTKKLHFDKYIRRARASFLARGYTIRTGTDKLPIRISSGSLESRLVKTLKVSAKGPLEKMHAVYDILETQALYLTPILDLNFNPREIELDDTGHEKTSLSDESYNSTKLFTLLTAMLGDARMLIYGPPGSGKTSTSNFIGSAVYNLLIDYVKQCTVLGHPEQTEEKLVAMYDPIKMLQGKRNLIIRQWLKSPIKIIDEINRLRPESLSILYELLQSGTVTYQGAVIKAITGPLYATANAVDSGNYQIPPPVKDRFDIAVIASSINPYYIDVLTNTRNSTLRRNPKKITLKNQVTPQDMAVIRRSIDQITIPSEVSGRIAHFLAEMQGCDMAGVEVEAKNKGNLGDRKPPAICSDCDHYSKDSNICSKTESDIGTRTVQSIYRYSRAMAFWRSHSSVALNDVSAVIPYVTWFKVSPTRASLDINPRFANDKIAFMRYLFSQSNENYDDIAQVIPEYPQMVQLVSPASKKKPSDIEGLMKRAGMLDTPAKYPLITALKKIYTDSK